MSSDFTDAQLTHWRNHRDSLVRQIEGLESGQIRSFTGRTLEIETTQQSLELARQSLAATERLLARHETDQA